ncbi:MAG TPA: 16S rRNA (cytosine(1402)-N(4))-methyltransferase [Lachnospiraceae bacterium]|nr:16S rRNA (cytosine(1402)-N(4))-methyltransferase [Lachnospiraceae bacterium]
MEFKHESVLLEEVIRGLNIRPWGIYVDGTLGGGGHSFRIAEKLTEGGRLIGIDQDRDALQAAGQRLAPFEDRVTLVHDNYEHMGRVLSDLCIDKIDGILLDLGVSSYQLDNPERGFSYNTDAPLDMRMDRDDNALTAREIVNTWPAEELANILRDYGEERYARAVAANIVKEREKGPLETTGQLSEIVRRSIPKKMQQRGGNPCKRTFQAIRIACNRELDVLADSLDEMMERLAPGGRFCIITFHSLEDRIVKTAFRRWENPCTCPPEFPVCVCGRKPMGKCVSRKAILPSKEELEHNKRSASAKLRIFEKAADGGKEQDL